MLDCVSFTFFDAHPNTNEMLLGSSALLSLINFGFARVGHAGSCGNLDAGAAVLQQRVLRRADLVTFPALLLQV